MLWLAALLTVTLQTASPVQLGAIEGTVTQSANGAPIAGAHIKVVEQRPDRSPAFSGETITDGTGRFTVREVPAGFYEVQITHEQFAPPGGQQDRAAVSTAITVRAGETARVPTVVLSAASVIYGRVLDAEGKGVSSAAVEILRRGTDGQGRKLWFPIQGRAITDDQGAYRKTLFGEGDYYARAILESGTTATIVYYPETGESSEAAPISVKEGAETRADIRIGAAVTSETFHISGQSMLPPVEAASPFIVLTLAKRNPNGPVDPSSNLQTSTRASEGVADFELNGIRPGNYELVANARINGQTFTGKLPIDIRDRDVDKVEVSLRAPMDVKGRLIFDGEVQNVQLSRSRTDAGFNGLASGGHTADVILAMNEKGALTNPANVPKAVIDASGLSFSFRDIPEGEYLIAASLLTDGKPDSQGLFVADIRAGGRSVMENGFHVGIDPVDSIEVVISAQSGSIEGRVVGSRPNQPLTLIALPEDSRRNRSLFRMVDIRDANFQMRLPPGSYKIFAIPSTDLLLPFRGSPGQYESRALSVTVQKGMTSGGFQIPYFEP